MATLAWLGTGAMGSRIAQNFIAGGHDLFVYNRTPEKTEALRIAGATVCPTAEEAARHAEVVFAMVSDDDASQTLWLGEHGALAGLQPGAVAVESTSAGPVWIRQLAEHVHKRDALFLDAPVLGSRPQAESKKLIVLASGDPAAFALVQPLYALSASLIHYLGEVGQAACMKLAINAQYAAQVAIWSETLAILEGQGIARARAVEIINTAQSTSPTMQVVGAQIAAAQFAPMFPIDLVEKDLRYAAKLGAATGLRTPVLQATLTEFQRAQNAGFGELNISGVAQLQAKQSAKP